MTDLAFIKMHGLGNDFVVIDARTAPAPQLRSADYPALGDRRRGIGYDQFLTLLPAEAGGDARLHIRNPDGTEAEACGNGTRCAAALLMAESGAESAVIETVAGLLTCRREGDGRITVDMGEAGLLWSDIPLAAEMDTLCVPLADAALSDACCVAIGNPHAVFFVENAETVPLAEVGPVLETHALFPARANIEIAEVRSPTEIRMRVWERGVGITEACGSGACAVLVAAVRRGLAERRAEIILDGGTLSVEWNEAGRVLMTGATETSFTGTIKLPLSGKA